MSEDDYSDSYSDSHYSSSEGGGDAGELTGIEYFSDGQCEIYEKNWESAIDLFQQCIAKEKEADQYIKTGEAYGKIIKCNAKMKKQDLIKNTLIFQFLQEIKEHNKLLQAGMVKQIKSELENIPGKFKRQQLMTQFNITIAELQLDWIFPKEEPILEPTQEPVDQTPKPSNETKMSENKTPDVELGNNSHLGIEAARIEIAKQDDAQEKMIKEAKEQKKQKEEKLLIEKTKLADEKMKIESDKKRREDIIANLPEEPGKDDPDVLNCVIRLPNGKRIYRRFKKIRKIQLLWDYVFIQDNIGFDEEDDKTKFCIQNGFPRKQIEDCEVTFQEKFGDKKKELFLVHIC